MILFHGYKDIETNEKIFQRLSLKYNHKDPSLFRVPLRPTTFSHNISIITDQYMNMLFYNNIKKQYKDYEIYNGVENWDYDDVM